MCIPQPKNSFLLYNEFEGRIYASVLEWMLWIKKINTKNSTDSSEGKKFNAYFFCEQLESYCVWVVV